MIKLKWYSWGKGLSHIAIGLLFVSVVLTNVTYQEEYVCLKKQVPITGSEFTVTLQNTIQAIPQYVGEKEQYALEFSKGPYQFSAYPSIWQYQRSKGVETLKNPFVQILPEADVIVIPRQKGRKTLILNKETKIEGAIVTWKEYSRSTNDQGLIVEKVVINFQKEIERGSQETYLLQENYTMSRRLTRNGLPIEIARMTPSLLGEEIEWISTENEKTILISSKSIADTYEFNILTKPYMLLLRFSYFLLILSLLWLALMNQWEKKLAKRFKKNRRKDVVRDHHTHHHNN